MELHCDRCGDAFTGRAGARYCSGRCRTQAYRERHHGPSQPRHRRPLPDAFWETVYDLEKRAEALDRLANDDRFPRNAQRLADRGERHRLIRITDMLHQVIERLPEPQPLQRTDL